MNKRGWRCASPLSFWQPLFTGIPFQSAAKEDNVETAHSGGDAFQNRPINIFYVHYMLLCKSGGRPCAGLLPSARKSSPNHTGAHPIPV